MRVKVYLEDLDVTGGIGLTWILKQGVSVWTGVSLFSQLRPVENRIEGNRKGDAFFDLLCDYRHLETLHPLVDQTTGTRRDFEEGSPGYETVPLVSKTQESEISRLVDSEFMVTKCSCGLNSSAELIRITMFQNIKLTINKVNAP
jgi:hypothetical protein